jgi:ferritin-like metal-binding protein YciE
MRKNVIEKQAHAFPFANQQSELGEKGMLRSYFAEELRSLYWTEKCLLKNLPKIQNAAVTVELQEALEDHSSVTDDHVERVEQIFSMLNESAQVRKCEAMDSMLKDIGHLSFRLGQTNFTKDFAIVAAVNKIQHYQVASYHNMIHMANILREPVIEGILQRSLSEEKKAMDVFNAFIKTHLSETNLLEAESE